VVSVMRGECVEKVGSTAFSVSQNLDFAWKTDASRLVILDKHMNCLERINNPEQCWVGPKRFRYGTVTCCHYDHRRRHHHHLHHHHCLFVYRDLCQCVPWVLLS